jgi:hypothetical protein
MTVPNANPEIDLESEAFKSAVERRALEQFNSLKEKAVQEETAGLLSKRDELLAEKKALKEWKDSMSSKYNFEELDKQLEEAKKAKEQAMTAEERFDLRFKEMSSEFTKERTVFQTALEKKDAALKKHLVESELKSQIAKANGMEHLLTPVLRGQIQVVEENGDYVARVMKNGNPRIGGTDGSYMTIEQLVNEFKSDADYGVCFKASGATGGDATGSTAKTAASGSGDANLKRGEMTFKQKSEYISTHGQAKYLALPV